MIEIKTDIPDFEKITYRKMRILRRMMKEAHRESAKKAIDIVENVLENLDVNASGRLSKSLRYKLENDSVDSDLFQSVVYFKGVNYVDYANDGRGSGGRPPYAAIEKYLKAKGTYSSPSHVIAVQKSIAEYGTEGKKFIEESQPIIRKESSKILKRKIKEYLNATSNNSSKSR